MERINKALSPKVADQKLKKIEPIKITVGNSHNKKTIQVQNGSNGSSSKSPSDQGSYGPPLPPSISTPTQNRHGHGSPLAVSTPAVSTAVSPDSRRPNGKRRPKKNFEEDLDMFETAEDPFDTFGTTTTPPKSSKLKIETKVTPKVTQTNPLTGTPVGPGRISTNVRAAAVDRKAELRMDSPNKTPSIPSPVPKPIPRVQSDAGKSDFWTKG